MHKFIKTIAALLSLITLASVLPFYIFAASNSTVVLHPSIATPTGVLVEVGGKINGYTITKISGYDITVDLGKYNVNNNSFRLPYANTLWSGVGSVEYISWAGSGSNKRSEGASALLANGKNTAYYYFKADPTYTYTLNYNANGGSGAPADQSVSTADSSGVFTISSEKPSRQDYAFLGWSTDKNADLPEYVSGEAIRIGHDLTIYAVWQKITPETKTITLTYHDNFGDSDHTATESKISTLNESKWSPVIFSLMDYTEIDSFSIPRDRRFIGWSETRDGVIISDSLYAVSEDSDVYAIWEDVETYTVTYTDGTGGEEVFADQITRELLAGDETPKFDGTPVRKGYVFAGWTPEVAEKVTGTAVYTAQWKEDRNGNGQADDEEETYTVTYTDGTGGEEVFADQIAKGLLAGDETPKFAGTPNRDGYEFKGWTPAIAETVTEDATYTAVWEAEEKEYRKKIVFKVVNVTWDGYDSADKVLWLTLKDGDGNNSEDGTAAAEIPTGMQANSGYKGGRWDPAPENPISASSPEEYTYSFSKKTGGGSSTLKYTLTFETNGGSKISSITKSKNAVVELDAYEPVKAENVFEGWYADKALTEAVTSVRITGHMTVYAKWSEINKRQPSLLTDAHDAYIVGRQDGLVYPEANITRAEVATIFFRLLTDEARKENYTKDNAFRDVVTGDWYNTAISTLAKLNILKGRGEDRFDPDAYISRAEFAVIAARFSDAAYAGEDIFGDIAGHWAEEEINSAAELGWVIGDNGLFRPNDCITRAEAMALVNRVLCRQPETAADILREDMVCWPDNSDENAWYYLIVQEATNSHSYEMKSDGRHEKWAQLKSPRNWTVLEK